MGIIKQHRPDYFTGYENQVKQFNSLKELLAIEFVDNFTKLPNDKPDPNFFQFSKCAPDETQLYLMAEFNLGSKWLVIGHIKDEGDTLKDLTTWIPVR